MPILSERAFSWQMRELLALLGYRLVYATWVSLHSPAGFPDLCALRPGDGERPGRLAFLELKIGRNRLTGSQRAWLDALNSVPGITALEVRPGDEQMVADILRGDAP